MRKYSRQREAIMQNLSHRYDHPTAETVYLDIKNEFPNISLGTVYRNLSLLADSGEIQKIATGSGPDRFDGNPAPHYHFTCNGCGRVLDLEFEKDPDLSGLKATNFHGIIKNVQMNFHGLCEDCIK